MPTGLFLGRGYRLGQQLRLGSMPVDRSNYTPTVEDVGELLRSRTVDANSNELGTFTTDTRPTADQVERFIARAVPKVTDKIGTDIPASLWESASEVIALRAAMLIEQGYFGNQIKPDRAPYDVLKELYDEGIADLVAAWKNLGSDGQPGTPDDIGTGLPVISGGGSAIWSERIW